MKELDFSLGCGDEFAKLCALSTSGSLNSEEWQRLKLHLSRCPQCTALLAEYNGVISENIVKLGAQRSEQLEGSQGLRWKRDQARQRFLVSLEERAVDQKILEPQRRRPSLLEAGAFHRFDLPHPVSLFRAVAVVILIAGLAYVFGLKRGTPRGAQIERSSLINETSLKKQLGEAQSERVALNRKIAEDGELIHASDARAARAETELRQLQALNASLETKAADLAAKDEQQLKSVGALSAEREALQKQLEDTEISVQAARQELSASEEERRKMLLHSASLAAENGQLSAQLHEGEQAAQREQQYLASDRDIRELMGARQLYIADVFDVDPQGETKKPFGRVFYTKGKSLIFYVFDLEKQPGYREAKAFQAWGRAGSIKATPVSLGIFYMDNESNRRWALKFDNPKVLEEISAVFVTLEPKGGSMKPTNKPFLLAYLHTAPPNHP
jgi:hypothetical protein